MQILEGTSQLQRIANPILHKQLQLILPLPLRQSLYRRKMRAPIIHLPPKSPINPLNNNEKILIPRFLPEAMKGYDVGVGESLKELGFDG